VQRGLVEEASDAVATIQNLSTSVSSESIRLSSAGAVPPARTRVRTRQAIAERARHLSENAPRRTPTDLAALAGVYGAPPTQRGLRTDNVRASIVTTTNSQS
jgi:hypothetical protein